MRPVIAIIILGLFIPLGSTTTAEEWTIIDAPIVVRDEVRSIVPERPQVEVMQNWIEWRIEHVLPRLMKHHGVDAWVLLRHRDPTYLTLVEANAEGMILRRPRLLLMVLAGDHVKRVELSETDMLPSTLARLDPKSVAVSDEDRDRLETLLPEAMRQRLQSSMVLETEFLQEQAPEAISVFEHVARVANEIYAEAFSNIAITPDVTTSDDLNWWIRDRYKALGLETYDHPTITVQRAAAVRAAYGDADEAFQISYRKALYDKLKAGGYVVNDEIFFGTLFSGESVADFDPDHEGHPGWSTDEIVAGRTGSGEGKLSDWLIAEEPNIILLHIGTNDISGGNEDWHEVEDILGVIDDYEFTSENAVGVILALIIDRSCDPFIIPCLKSPETSSFNNDVRDFVFFPRQAGGDKIVLVDMQIGAGINYDRWDMGGDMWDNLHPFETGYTKMADLWFSALMAILPQADAGPDQIVFDEITLDGSLSNHPDGQIISYQWQLNHRQNSDFNRTATGVSPSVLNLKKGFYDVTLIVEDVEASTDTDQMLFSATGPKGDFDFDGDVDEYDLSVFGEYYGIIE